MIGSAFLLLAMTPSASPEETAFEKSVRPLLIDYCIKCHGPDKASNNLRLDSRDGLMKGGDKGVAVVPGKPEESLLLKAVRREKGVEPMPPKNPLKPEQIASLEKWIKDGAVWPEQSGTLKTERHWAFEPVRSVSPPGGNFANPIDAFLGAKQKEKGIRPASRADAATLLRRATYDLTGLPPSTDEVDAFLKDESANAFEKAIDRLLASPAYGERWGRHWLDVVRYADTAGETADFPVADAWRYRNYVINSFNADKPYDQFVREQLAGDILANRLPKDAPDERFAELIAATGYLAVARRFGFDTEKDHFLTIEDVIDTFGKSFLGLSVACARCHDHKYDPISARDYYALYGVFESTRFPKPGCEKDKSPRDMVPLCGPQEYASRKTQRQMELKIFEIALAERERKLQALPAPVEISSGEFPNGGKQDFSAAKLADNLRKVTVAKGEMLRLTILPKANHGADSTLVEWEIREIGGKARIWNLTRDLLNDFRQNGEGCRHSDSHGNSGVWNLLDVSGSPRLLSTFIENAEKTPGLQVWRGGEDWPSALFNTNDKAVAYQTVKQPAKSLNLHPGPRGGVAVAWQAPIDGTFEIVGRVEDLDASGGDGIEWKIFKHPGYAEELVAIRKLAETVASKRKELEDLDKQVPKGYAVQEGQPHDAQLHKRGDPDNRGDSIPRKFLTVLGGQSLIEGGGSGRLQLAEMLVDPKNPLTARVIVNRIWQHHFGTGLVATPNDFGTRGSPPTHPELLDYLAKRFIDSGYSFKSIHRLILLSDTFQRSSITPNSEFRTPDSELGKTPNSEDSENLTLWHFPRRRLSAEEIRDALLATAGDLDQSPGTGHPFPEAKNWNYTQHNPFSAVYDTSHRSVYLMVQRIKRHPFLALFDGADPNSSTPLRPTTTVPTQALYFMNDPFVHARAESLAKELMKLADRTARIDRACHLLYGRPVTASDQARAEKFLSSSGDTVSGWSSWLRVMFASNEFLYVD